MNTKLFFIAVLGFLINCVIHPMEHNCPQVKTSPTASESEQSSVLFSGAIHVAAPWHYGPEITHLQTVIAKALVIVKENSASQEVYQSVRDIHTQKLDKLAGDMEPRKKCLADAQQLTTTMASTLISNRKALLHDGLLATVAALNDVIALQDSRVQDLMKRNGELEAVLSSKN